MDESVLLNGVLRSVLGGRGRRRSRRALNYITGRGRGSFLTNPSTLLTVAGMAWGVFETMQQSGALGSPGSQGSSPPPSPPPSWASIPLPNAAETNTAVPSATVSAEAMRIVRLAISAANADGSVSDVERTSILDQAKAAGVGDLVEAEIGQPRPLSEIVAGVSDPGQRATLYVLAFSMVRGDEQPTGSERIYLAQLANLLGIDAATMTQLEQHAALGIDAEPEVAGSR